MVPEGLQNGATVRDKSFHGLKIFKSPFFDIGQNQVHKTGSRKFDNEFSYEIVYPDLFLHVESIAVEVESLK